MPIDRALFPKSKTIGDMASLIISGKNTASRNRDNLEKGVFEAQMASSVKPNLKREQENDNYKRVVKNAEHQNLSVAGMK